MGTIFFSRVLSLLFAVVLVVGLFPQGTSSLTCGAGTVISNQCVVFLTSGTTWAVPGDFTANSNTIEVIGGGGGPGFTGGGGGGGYSKSSNVFLTPGSTVTIAIGSGGGSSTAGGDTYICNSTSNCANIASSSVMVGAKGGSAGGASGSTAAGGAAASGVGSTKFSGGSTGNPNFNCGNTGGGGAGGPHGNGGGSGGSGDGTCTIGIGGTGGGGGGGGGTSAGNVSSLSGNAGGNNYAGSGGGAANTSGTVGGGGGGGDRGVNAGNGGAGTEWDSSHGSGGGGGGGGNSNLTAGTGGNGGLYGGGGGAGVNTTGGTGAQGIIVITDLPAFIHNVVTLSNTATVTGGASIVGTVSKGSGTFAIDDPLDPKNKILYHSFVESPDVMNIYDGIATLDGSGSATIWLPGYFLPLNKEFRYLATPIGQSMPNLFLSSEIQSWFLGLFGSPVLKISGGVPHGKISWQVTGIRHDPFILANPIIPEVLKGPDQLVDKGQYLFPEFYAK